MIFSLLKYYYFKLKATNQHGVHSPYLYALVCFCFYNKKWKRLRKTPYNKVNQVLMYKEILNLLNSFSEYAVNEFKIPKPLMRYIEGKKNDFRTIEIQKDKSQIILIDNLHLQRKSWKEFTKRPTCITLDLYYLGIIIHREEQLPQSFRLKVF